MNQEATGYCPVCFGRLEDTPIRLDPDLEPRQRIRCLNCETVFEVLIAPPDRKSPSIWTVALSAARNARGRPRRPSARREDRAEGRGRKSSFAATPTA